MSVSVCYHESYNSPWGREGSRLGQRSSWSQRSGASNSYPAEGRGLVSAPCRSLELANPSACGLGLISGMKGSFPLEASPQGPWAESSSMWGDLGRALQCRDIPGKLGGWKNRLWCFNWDTSLCLRAGWFKEARWPAERWGCFPPERDAY